MAFFSCFKISSYLSKIIHNIFCGFSHQIGIPREGFIFVVFLNLQNYAAAIVVMSTKLCGGDCSNASLQKFMIINPYAFLQDTLPGVTQGIKIDFETGYEQPGSGEAQIR